MGIAAPAVFHGQAEEPDGLPIVPPLLPLILRRIEKVHEGVGVDRREETALPRDLQGLAQSCGGRAFAVGIGRHFDGRLDVGVGQIREQKMQMQRPRLLPHLLPVDHGGRQGGVKMERCIHDRHLARHAIGAAGNADGREEHGQAQGASHSAKRHRPPPA